MIILLIVSIVAQLTLSKVAFESEYHLGIFELDDQGLYHHRAQLDEMFDWVRDLLDESGD